MLSKRMMETQRHKKLDPLERPGKGKKNKLEKAVDRE